MLRDIDKVNWAQLGHCRGSAADLPNLLRRWAAGGSSAPVFDALCHSGNVWGDAAPAAIPFVAEIARAPGPSRQEAAFMLVAMWTAVPAGGAPRDTRAAVEELAPTIAAVTDQPGVAVLLGLVAGPRLANTANLARFTTHNDPVLAAAAVLASRRARGEPLDDAAFDGLRGADPELEAALDDLSEGEPLNDTTLVDVVDLLLEHPSFAW